MAIFELLIGRKSKPPQILFGSTDIVLLQLDVALNEEHVYENKIPQYPIDATNVITDHIWQSPDRLNIEGHVSNYPLKTILFDRDTFQSRDSTAIGGQDKDRVLTAYEMLLTLSGRKLVKNAKDNVGQGTIYHPVVVDIITNLCIFTDMVIETLTIPRNSGVNNELIFQVQFVKITRASVQETNITYVNDKLYGAEGVGDQNSTTKVKGKQPETTTVGNNNTHLRNMVDGGKKGLSTWGPKLKTLLFGTGN